jgi:glycosyltransferase involved in cell wall biosynthesis
MSCSVPAIATRVGGVSELIEDNINGQLFSVGDIEAMAHAAITLLRDEPRLDRMAAAARRTAEDHFSTTSIIPLYEDYYRRVITRTTTHP